MSHRRFALEKYLSRGQTRFSCPSCGHRGAFVRYVDTQTGNHVADECGRCNRESKCGYHQPPSAFFAAHPQLSNISDARAARARQPARISFASAPKLVAAEPFDTIPKSVFERTVSFAKENNFARYLFALVDGRDVSAALENYGVGTWENGETVFWQIDGQFRVRTGQIIRYDASTGRRLKDGLAADWVHAALKRTGALSADFSLRQCFFGEHLLAHEINKPIAIVESPKAAVIASIFVPSYVWLACGGKSYLSKIDRLKTLAGRRVTLFPDGDAFELWMNTAIAATRAGLNVVCSDLIETFATVEEKANGLDVADYLLSAKINERERSNEIIDQILQDANLLDALGERLAIAEFDALLPRETVESPGFVRTLAAEVYAAHFLRQRGEKK